MLWVKHEFPEHQPQRAEGNAHNNKHDGVCRAHTSHAHVMKAAGAPGTHTFFVRVGFCPLLTTRRRFAVILSRTHHNEHSFLLPFFTKDC